MKPVTQPTSPQPATDERLLAVAESLKPSLFHRTVEPSTSWTRAAAGGTVEGPLGPGDRAFFDFGEHLVGRATLSLGSTGSHPDAPAWLRVSFAERLSEFGEDADAYDAWISKG